MTPEVDTTTVESNTTTADDRVMRTPIALLTVLVALLSMPSTALGQFGPGGRSSPPSAEDLVDVRAAADVDAIQPGQTFHLAFIYDIEPAWHIYWVNPGVSGLPPSIDVEAPDGFEVGEIRWPRPSAIQEPQGLAYGYDDMAVLFVPITAPADFADDEVEFTASLRWLVCKEMCLMGRGKASVTIPASDNGDSRQTDDRDIVRTFLDRLPVPIDTVSNGAKVRYADGTLTVEGPIHDADSVEFFPIELPGVQYGEAIVEIDDADNRYRLTVPVEWDESNAMGGSFEIRAVVGLGDDPDQPAYSIHLRPDADA